MNRTMISKLQALIRNNIHSAISKRVLTILSETITWGNAVVLSHGNPLQRLKVLMLINIQGPSAQLNQSSMN